MIAKDTEKVLEGRELWRLQCARNLMDCYTLGMEMMGSSWEKGVPAPPALDAMTRLMVDGMTSVRNREDEQSFYRTAAGLCRECAKICRKEKARLFRTYAAIFEEKGESRE